MKKVLALSLTLLMLLAAFTACRKEQPTTLHGEGDKGAVIDLWLGEEFRDLDPAFAYTDDIKTRIVSLLYEGLTVLDADGNIQYGMLKNYKQKVNADGTVALTLTLIDDSGWSDGRTVQATDFVYAWKRLLNPNNKATTAALLFDIVNAYETKMGDCSPDHIGVIAKSPKTIEVTLKQGADVERFLANLASPALVPLRSEHAETLNSEWASYETLLEGMLWSNGPFKLSSVGEEIVLERNAYYKRIDEVDVLDRTVIPYRLVLHFTDSEDIPAEFEASEIFAIAGIPASLRSQYRADAKTVPALNTASLYFNLNNEKLANVLIRQALSLALDRTAIANRLVAASPATGLIPEGVRGLTASFRAEAGDILSATANVEKARSLIAGKTIGTLKIGARVGHEGDLIVAEEVKKAWAAIGVTATVEELTDAEVREAIDTGDFDVLLVDLQSMSNQPFQALAAYSTDYCGSGIDMAHIGEKGNDYPALPNCLGYASAEYDAEMKKAFEAVTTADRIDACIKAEAILMIDLPVVPIVTLENMYILSSDLSGVKVNGYGALIFTETMRANYYEEAADA